MAETAVSLVIDKLVSFLAKEVKILGSKTLRRDVKFIKDELESIRSFLKDADARAEREEESNNSTGVETWVKQVREVAYQIEDVVDEYMLGQKLAQHGHQHGFTRYLKKITHLVRNFKWRHWIATEVRDIKTSVCDIKERSDRYSFSTSTEGSVRVNERRIAWHGPRVASLFISEDEVVGISAAKKELIGLLQDDPTTRTVISVVGMGGIGKTTLAKIVSESWEVKDYFECCAWITVSQSYKKVELLRSMIRQFCPAQEPSGKENVGASEQEVLLISKLRQYLHGRRYVVVFDDVWKVNFWADIEHALPGESIGSRIMITTRNKDVASFCKKSSFVRIYDLQCLPQNLAWELFCKKTFQFDFEGRGCPSVLEKLSLEFVGKCGGLPLAIVAIAGLLSTKDKSVSEWQKFHDMLRYELDSNPHLTNITKILSLSYHDLPSYLKPCFIYFGIFPEDYSIFSRRLVWEWIAEGFVEVKKGIALEQVGEGYILELIQRNMIQWDSWKCDGVNMYCKVHDLMYETILSKTGKSRFCQVLDAEDLSLYKEARRLSIQNNLCYLPDMKDRFAIRSMFVFEVSELPSSFMDTLFERSKLLKVLDLEDAPLDYLPENVGYLLHLRYLSVCNTKIKMLPMSIGNLLNLQTLNLQNTLVEEVPIEIYRLFNLQHLVTGRFNSAVHSCWNSVSGMRIHPGIGDLKELRTLVGVEAAKDDFGLIKELMKLRQLRNLYIMNLTEEMGRILCAAIERMNHLEFLALSSVTESFLDLDFISNPPQLLSNLCLFGRLQKLPHWIFKLHNVVTLSLNFSRLVDNPVENVQALPNLTYLYLCEAYNGKRLHIEKEWFPKLKELYLKCLEELCEFTIEAGALPRLEKLEIGPCPHMKVMSMELFVPVNLVYLTFVRRHAEVICHQYATRPRPRLLESEAHTACLFFLQNGRRWLGKVQAWQLRLVTVFAKLNAAQISSSFIKFKVDLKDFYPREPCFFT